ncbi:hypothetical protein CFP56_024978 [Quercus suber]|uniref:Uncharacterized protein n=1 Tax=Quercus suber TaxID=58331 RepID=A0AAW0LWQ4_QUESU
MPQDLPGFYYDKEKNRYFPIKGPIPGSSRSSSLATAQEPTPKSTRCALAKIFHLFDWFDACGVITLMVQVSFWWFRNILISGNGWHTLRHVLYLGGLITTYPSREVVSLPMALGEQGEFLGSTPGNSSHSRGLTAVTQLVVAMATGFVVAVISRAKFQVWKYGGTDKIVNGALEQIHIDVQTLEGQSEMDVLLAGGVHGSLRHPNVSFSRFSVCGGNGALTYLLYFSAFLWFYVTFSTNGLVIQ